MELGKKFQGETWHNLMQHAAVVGVSLLVGAVSAFALRAHLGDWLWHMLFSPR